MAWSRRCSYLLYDHTQMSWSGRKSIKLQATFVAILAGYLCCDYLSRFPEGSRFTLLYVDKVLDVPATPEELMSEHPHEVRKLDPSGYGFRSVFVGGTVVCALALAKRSHALKRAVRVAGRKFAEYSPRCIGRLLQTTPSFLNWRPPSPVQFGVTALPVQCTESCDSSIPDSTPRSAGTSLRRSVSVPTMGVRRTLVLPVQNRRAKTCKASVLAGATAGLGAEKGSRWTPRACEVAGSATQAAFSSSPQLDAELGEVFDAYATPKGCLCPALLAHVVDLLNEKFGIGLQTSDTARLKSMLSQNGEDGIDRQTFLSTMGSLLAALKYSKGLSIAQLRIVMATAFERFDLDGDGIISETEFAAALSSCDIELPHSQVAILLKFLSPSSSHAAVAVARRDLAGTDSASLEDQLQAAFQGAREKLVEATGWNTALKMASNVLAVLEEPHTPKSQIYRILAASVGKDVTSEMLADTSELLMTLASVVLVLQTHSHGSQMLPHEWMDQLRLLTNDLVSAFNDLVQSGPMGPVLLSGVLGAFKALQTQETATLEREGSAAVCSHLVTGSV